MKLTDGCPKILYIKFRNEVWYSANRLHDHASQLRASLDWTRDLFYALPLFGIRAIDAERVHGWGNSIITHIA